MSSDRTPSRRDEDSAAPVRRHHASVFLFVPGDRERKIEKAFGTEAEAIILDLEDGVASEAKNRARETLLATFAQLPPERVAAKQVILRCNAADTPFFLEDLALARSLSVDAIMLPKCEERSSIETVLRIVPEMEIIPLIESARGITEFRQIVTAGPTIQRAAFGAVDFALDINADWSPCGDERKWAMAELVLQSRALGLKAPLGGVFPVLDDRAALQADARYERSIGFFGKMIIHPRQIEWVAEVYRIAPELRNWSRKVVEAYEAAGAGSLEIEGKLVDLPVYFKAKRIVRITEEAEQ